MSLEIKIFNYSSVNCYLLKACDNYTLIDTGFSFSRNALKKELREQGCQPGSLKLIVLTHGDFDHAGNAAYFREKFGGRIAVHRHETEAVENGDMTLDRRSRQGIAIRVIAPLFKSLIFTKFKPDLYVEEGDELTEYGFDARVLHIPGHTLGSIGVLTSEGDLFCGDLLTGGDRPLLNSLIDNFAEAAASLEKLKTLNIKTVYPGHGKPFSMDSFFKMQTGPG